MDRRDVGVPESARKGLGVERFGRGQLLQLHSAFLGGGQRQPDVLEGVLEREFRRPILGFDLAIGIEQIVGWRGGVGGDFGAGGGAGHMALLAGGAAVDAEPDDAAAQFKARLGALDLDLGGTSSATLSDSSK